MGPAPQGMLLPALYYIPFATLGAVVCNAVVNLVDWPEMIKAFFLSPLDCLVMLVRPALPPFP